MRAVILGCALIMATIAARPATARADGDQPDMLSDVQQSVYAYAMESFRQHRYAAAYGSFARLADAGHLPSAQLALVMYTNGRTLFGSDWDATPEQLEHWNSLVVDDARQRKDSAPAR